jgi:hypothetical protein
MNLKAKTAVMITVQRNFPDESAQMLKARLHPLVIGRLVAFGKGKGRSACCDPGDYCDGLIVVTPIHPASYPALVTIVTTNIRPPIIAVPPIAVIPIGTRIAIIPIGTMGVAVVAVAVAVISTAICTPMDASNTSGC